MKVVFTINYHTFWGQSLWIGCPGSKEEEMISMKYISSGYWAAEIEMDRKSFRNFEYKYYLRQEGMETVPEWGHFRKVDIDKRNLEELHIRDAWRPSGDPENIFYSSAFTGNLLKRGKTPGRKNDKKTGNKGNYCFRLSAPRIRPDHIVCIVGNHNALGNWSPDSGVILEDRDYPLWQTEIDFGGYSGIIEYKYCIYSSKKKQLIAWETGENRKLFVEAANGKIYHLISDIRFRSNEKLWRGSGISIPVFSLRTHNSGGVGEFPDLKLLIKWAARSHMRLVQILPVNDTVAHHTWQDSYPYSAISVFALHPLYLNMKAMGVLKEKREMKKFMEAGKRLNALEKLDYEAVMELKSKFYKRLYDEQKKTVLKSPGFKKFFRRNRKWLVPYAVFSCLRDRYKTVDYSKWGEYAIYNKKKVRAFADPSTGHYDDVAVHYFIQFHLHLQMKEVADYARKQGVILKGDLPIGIYRYSVDAWQKPTLFNMDKQAGAPPDAFSESGQNWRFPTYNWDEMARDRYRWWRNRLYKMAEYFDAYRIDHILGFFRIWEMSYDQVDGLLGKFNPAIPLTREDIERFGVQLDPGKYTKPLVRESMLDELFGSYKETVIEQCLTSTGDNVYELNPECDTQRKAAELFSAGAEDSDAEKERKDIILKGLFKLISNVLFISDEHIKAAYHPRISFQFTYAFRELDKREQSALNGLYNYYFYDMQETFWEKQAMKKLPAVAGATNMMVCGEDLGMVPQCVPKVMEQLGILGLEIQRMPKYHSMEFSNPLQAKYLTVVSTSTHDMSTIREWWEEDPEVTRRFYNQQLGMKGEAPAICTREIARKIVELLLDSPAMWAIYPVQDLLAMSDKLRNPDVHDERINIPGISNHYWRYRLHLYVEDLKDQGGFRDLIRGMLRRSGRGQIPGL